MSAPERPDDSWEARFRALESRLSNIEKHGSSALDGGDGVWSMVDDDGVVRVTIGKLGASSWGMKTFDGAGDPVFTVDESGWTLH